MGFVQTLTLQYCLLGRSQTIKIYFEQMNYNNTYRTVAKSPKYPRSNTEITPQQTQATSSKTSSIISKASNSQNLPKSSINSPKMIKNNSSSTFFKKTNMQIQVSQQNLPRLRKSNVISYLLQRLQKKMKRQTLKQIYFTKQAIKLKALKFTKLLMLSLNQFQQRERKKRYSWGIQKLKLITSKRGNENYRIENEYGKIYKQKRVYLLPQMIVLLIQRKMRDFMESIKSNHLRVGKIIRCCPALFNNLEKKAIRKSFNKLSSYCKFGWYQRHKLLSFTSLIFAKSIQSHTQVPFHKIVRFTASCSPPQVQNIPISPRIQNQKLQNSKNKEQIRIHSLQIGNLKQQIKRIQEAFKTQKQKKRVKQETFKKQTQQLSLQLQQNKQQKQAKRAQQISDQRQQQQIQDKYIFLQTLYSEISKLEDHQLTNILLKVRKAVVEDNSVSREWVGLRKRQELQAEVQRYEIDIIGQTQKTNTSSCLLRQQNALGRQMVRSYVKQRYLWGEVEKYVSKVI